MSLLTNQWKEFVARASNELTVAEERGFCPPSLQAANAQFSMIG